MIGVLTIIIRTINPAYPEGVMLAVLLMNVFAPLIDYYVTEFSVKKRIPNVIWTTVCFCGGVVFNMQFLFNICRILTKANAA